MAAKHPILFSAPMIRALANGSKTQTRRAITKPVPTSFPAWFHAGEFDPEFGGIVMRDAAGVGHGHWDQKPPYGVPGDYLWVRESFRFGAGFDGVSPSSIPLKLAKIHYDADGPAPEWAGKGRPSIHMPRACSRITLKVTGVRVERLQDISEEDALAEGIDAHFGCIVGTTGVGGYHQEITGDRYGPDAEHEDPVSAYQALWEQINGPGSWDANPWVWVIEFRVLTPEEHAQDLINDLQTYASTTGLDSKQIAHAMEVLQ